MKKLLFLLVILIGCSKDLSYNYECVRYLNGIPEDTINLKIYDLGFVHDFERRENYYWNSLVITPEDSIYVTVCKRY